MLFQERRTALELAHTELLRRKNERVSETNGVYWRYKYPVLTADHTPLEWRYDFDKERNPFLMERMGINAAFNAGAILLDDRYLMVVRVEGMDRKSFFAVAESATGIDQFKFWDEPIQLPQTETWDTNVYDMRLTQHEDGWIYGTFCSERKDPDADAGDTSSAVAAGGIVRTRDLLTWERLPDLVTLNSPQQRNVVLHPEFVDGKYAFYTRPQDGFIEAGSGGGIGWGLCDDVTHAVIDEERIIDPKTYHTIKEVKNGQGPAPLKTDQGWLHLAHGVRNTAAGLRYVLYLMLTDHDEPWRVTHRPAGYFIAPEGQERVGDVSNVTFCNGWVLKPNGTVLIYYASSDTRMHVAESTLERLLDYTMNTPEDPLYSHLCVEQRIALIRRNNA